MPPGPSRRRQIIAAIKARLEAIQVGTLFETSAGLHVFINETPKFGASDPTVAIAVVIGEDSVEIQQGYKLVIRMPLGVQAIAPATLDRAWQELEPVLADIKRAMELPDKRFGGLVEQELLRGSTQTMERDEGSTTVGVSVAYLATYTETWGNP